jgi:hypothetical protein
MSNDNTEGSTELSRRKLLALTSAAAVGGAAGCSSGNGGGGQTTDATENNASMGVGGGNDTANGGADGGPHADPYPNPEGEPIDNVAHILDPGGFNPFEWNGNYFGENPGNGWPSLGMPLYTSTRTRAANASYPLIALKNVERKKGGCEVVLELHEGWKWWDGTPATLKDYITHHKIAKHMSYGPNPEEETGDRSAYPGAKLTLENDYKITVTRKKPKAIGRARVEPGGLAAEELAIKHDYYKQWLEQYQDATTVEEADEITTNLQEHNISVKKFMEEGLGNTLYKPVEWSDTKMRGKKFEDHPRSHWTNIDEVVTTYYDDKQKRVQAFKTDKQDAVDPVRTPIRDLLPQKGFKMIKDFPYYYTRGVKFNFKRDHVHRRGVRRAIAYAMDHKKLEQALMGSEGYRAFPQQNQTGLGAASSRYYMGQDWMNNLIDYGVKAKFDKATEELKKAGYTKKSGQWVGPDGKPFNATVMGFPVARGPSEVQFFCSWMSDFGLKMKPQIITGSKFWTIMNETRDEIPEMMHLWGPGPYPNGMVSWNGSVLDESAEMAKPLEGTFEDCSSLTPDNLPKPELTMEKSPKYNRPARPEMPTMDNVGYTGTELPDETTTANLIWLDRKIESAQSIEQARKFSRKLAWYYNWNLPGFDFYSESWAQAGDVENFFWGDGSTDVEWKREVEMTIHHGIAQGRAEPHDGPPEGPMAPDINTG